MQTRFTAGLGAQLSLSAHSQSAVYVPGHVGDSLTSGDLSRGDFLVRVEMQAVQRLLHAYSLLTVEEIGEGLFPGSWSPASVHRVVLSGWHFDAQDSLGSLFRWHYENANRRKYLAELRTYERYGRWILPFYDYDLFDFFAGVPPELLYHQRLYLDTLLHKIFVDDLAPLARIPIAYEGSLRLAALSWRDRVVMMNPPAVLGDWILKRATDSRRREHLGSVDDRSTKPTGPDPLDHWWYEDRAFRQSVIETVKDWDGMKGIIDVSALLTLLQEPLSRHFIQFAVPALLTLYYFQQIVEGELSPVE
jgi:hypothetical protein